MAAGAAMFRLLFLLLRVGAFVRRVEFNTIKYRFDAIGETH